MWKILLVLVMAIPPAWGITLEMSLGVTKFSRQSDGIWYQEGFPHELKVTSLSGGIRLMSEKSLGGCAGAGWVG